MIREMAKRNNERLKFPVVKGKYLRHLSDRSSLQDKAKMEDFVQKMGWTTFAEMKAFKSEQEQKYSEIVSQRSGMQERISYLESLLGVYKEYEPYIKFHKEQWAVTGWERKKYERKHMAELAYYNAHCVHIKGMITESEKKIIPRTWEKELASLQTSLYKTQKLYAELVTKLSAVEVLEYNRRDLERMLGNESHDKNRNITRSKNRNDQSL